MQAARPPALVNAVELGAQRVPGGGAVRPAADQDDGPRPLGAHQRDVLPLGLLVRGRARHAHQQPPPPVSSVSATSMSPAAIEEKYGSEMSRSATPIIVLWPVATALACRLAV